MARVILSKRHPRSQYRRYTRNKAGNVFYGLFLLLCGLFSVLPLVYCVCTSFKPMEELLVFPPRFFVSRPTLDNYIVLPNLIANLMVPLSRYVFNSLFVSIVTTALHIVAASMAAFTFSKSKIKGRTALFLVVQFALLYNSYTLGIPQYILMSNMRIIDTYLVYILPYIPSAMGAFLMKQYIDSSIPDALLEAARIDGASVFRMYWSIVMPIVRPAWMTLLLFSFKDMWSVMPNGTIFSEELKTLPYVMSQINSGGLARAGSAMATTVTLFPGRCFAHALAQSCV